MEKIEVLDGGFVTFIDMMGSDQRVLDAARVSTGASSKGEKADRGLINYLMKNQHHTPFEKIVFEFHIKCPIFVARQWFRHRISSFNELSGRYREFEFEAYFPTEWRSPGTNNHQGSVTGDLTGDQQLAMDDILHEFYVTSKQAYDALLAEGAAKELARLVIPMAQYTEFYWTINMRSLMNFLNLRDDDHAQMEIREFARALRVIVEETGRIPMTLEAFDRHGYSGLNESLCKCNG